MGWVNVTGFILQAGAVEVSSIAALALQGARLREWLLGVNCWDLRVLGLQGWTQSPKQPGIVVERRKRRRNWIPRRANPGKWLKDRFGKVNDARLLSSEHRLVPKWCGKLRPRQEVTVVWRCKMQGQEPNL